VTRRDLSTHAAPGDLPRLLTASYWTYRPALGVPVRISLGRPQHMAVPDSIPALMPFGIFRRYEGAEFDRRYRDRLDGIGVERIAATFHDLGLAYAGTPLVLLCFEPPGRPCHRRMFADWWHRRTGVWVPEARA
jgi:hypothetical protein